MSELQTEARVVEKALVMDDQGRVLVINESGDPAKVEWDLPGGGREKREDREATLLRELEEELGITQGVTIGERVGSATFYLWRRGSWVTWIVSRAALSAEALQQVSQAEKAAFVPLEKLDPDEMFQSLISMMARRALQGQAA